MHVRIIETEPSGPLRCNARIRRDHLEKNAVSELHQVIVRTHDGMCTTGRDLHAERAADSATPSSRLNAATVR